MGELSPQAIYAAHCRAGRLAYQFDTQTQRAVFHPRVEPRPDEPRLEWRISRGLGTVHATTTVYRGGSPSHNVALIDLDEGFRMMSRVEDIAPMDVRIGMRVQLRMSAGTELLPPQPVFTVVPETS